MIQIIKVTTDIQIKTLERPKKMYMFNRRCYLGIFISLSERSQGDVFEEGVRHAYSKL